MSAEREAALRRIAIVLSTLPAPVAARLLGDLDAGAKQRVRRTMTSLADVDPLERQRALQAFSGTIRQRQSTPTSGDDEIVLTSVRRRDLGNHDNSTDSHLSGSPANTTFPTRQSSIDDSSPASHNDLSFLGDVEDDALVNAVHGEHPQTLALVLASIAPAQAARILPRLDASMRTDALGRIGRLGEIPSEMIQEIATHLKKRIEPTAKKVAETVSRQNSAGQRRLDAILAAMPAPAATTAPTPAWDGSRETAASKSTPATIHTDLAFASEAEPIPALRIAPQTVAPIASPAGPASSPAVPWSTDDIHQHLLRLKPVTLRDALAAVETHDAILALCGLPTSISDAVLATLPKNSAREIRHQIATIGPIELRAIDDAKERVAIASLPDQVRAQTIPMIPEQLPVAA